MKTYRTAQHEHAARAALEAADWLQTMRDAPTPEDRHSFKTWLKASPLHVRELLIATMVDRSLGAPDALAGFDLDHVLAEANADRNVVALALPAVAPAPAIALRTKSRRAPRRLRWAIAAALMIGVAVTGFTQLTQHETVSYASTLREQRIITLDDGSVVSLAPQTRISVRFSKAHRDIQLHAGEADFQVAHDTARPFRVHAGASIVQAVGTRFSVNRLPSGTVVAVSEGVVRLSADATGVLEDGVDAWLQSLRASNADKIRRPGAQVMMLDGARNLVAGERAHIASNGRALTLGRDEASPASTSTSTAGKRLRFHDDTLADIAAEFNRYNVTQLQVIGEPAQSQRYSGVFDADDAASFVQFLDCCSPLRVARDDRVVRIHTATDTARQ